MSILISLMVAWAGVSLPAAETSRRTNAQVGECVVKRRPDAAAEYVLDVQIDEADAQKMHRELPLVACWENFAANGGQQLVLPGDSLKYVLADALVRQELPGVPVNFAASPPLPRNKLTDEPIQTRSGRKISAKELEVQAEARRQALVDIDMAVFGECVARAAPQDSLALIMTKVGSPEEGTRLSVLSRVFAECAPAGQKAITELSGARGSIALSYYRLARLEAAE